jgi:hypothetical protein
MERVSLKYLAYADNAFFVWGGQLLGSVMDDPSSTGEEHATNPMLH